MRERERERERALSFFVPGQGGFTKTYDDMPFYTVEYLWKDNSVNWKESAF